MGGVAPDSATWTASTFTSYWLQRLSCCLWRENARTIALIANQTKNSFRVGGNNQDASADVLLASAAGFQQSNVLTNLNQNTLLTSASDDSDMSSLSPSRDSSPVRTPAATPFSFVVNDSHAQQQRAPVLPPPRQPVHQSHQQSASHQQYASHQQNASHQSHQSVSLMSSSLQTLSVTNRPRPSASASRTEFASDDRNRMIAAQEVNARHQPCRERYVFGQRESDSDPDSIESVLRRCGPVIAELEASSRFLSTRKCIVKPPRPQQLSVHAARRLQVLQAATISATMMTGSDQRATNTATSSTTGVIPVLAATGASVQETTADAVSASMT